MNRVSLLYLTLVVVSLPTLSLAGVFGGEEVKIDDPIAKMTVLLGDEGLCSGTIVDNDLVITAAHCTKLTAIRFGLDENHTEVRRSVACIHHPNFTVPKIAPFRWDVALLRFEGGLPEGYNKAPILPADVEMKLGDSAILAGYGRDDLGNYGTLHKTTVTISHLSDYSPIEVVFDQTHGTGACHGDSGGPAFYAFNGQLNLIGVTSGPYDNRDCDGQGVYQRVPTYLDWIAMASKKLRDAPVQDRPEDCIFP